MKDPPPETPHIEPPENGERGAVNSVIVGVVGIISAVYLFNPTAGIIELIPDNIPVIGNLDEAAAAAMLISCLAYFGLDLGRLFGKARKKDPKSSSQKGRTIDAEFVEER